MLGSMVYKYLAQSSKHTVVSTVREQFDVEKFLKKKGDFSYLLDFDYIVNCIGVIKPYCKDTDPTGIRNAILVNAFFPHILSGYCKNSSVKIIQIATDCVFSGKEGNYTEKSPHGALDAYGKTKSLGEVFSENMLNIRCSIIGPELKNKLGLLEWFLNQEDNTKVQGFTNHKWNGITTLQFAKLCLKIIESNKFSEFTRNSSCYHFIPNNIVSKYELLKLFQKIFERDIKVTPAKNEAKIDRTLTTNYPQFTNFYGRETMPDALLELNNFMEINYK